MIKIEVDEAYAFDMLAIAELKAKYKPTPQNRLNTTLMTTVIQDQITPELFTAIRESEPYEALLEANQTAYLLVDRIATGEKIGAEMVHNANMKRYHCKSKIQAVFFGKSLNEQKTV